MKISTTALSSTTPELAIVIVNWNSADYLRECLASIVEETRELVYEVVVVDSGSTREGVDQVVGEFPFVRLMKTRNIGFACANNLGFRNTRAPYVLFLNPDTKIEGPAITAMTRALNQTPDAGVIGCRLLNSDHTLQTSCVQRYPRVLNQALGTDVLYSWFPQLPIWGMAPLYSTTHEPVRVEAVSGACLMIRREVFEAAGLFSEEYFMYAEDVDLCYKATQAGWRCYYVPEATVVHYGGGSSRQREVNSWAAVVQCGSKLQFMRKTRGMVYGNLYRFAMAVTAALRWLVLAGSTAILANRDRRRRVRQSMAKWAAIFSWSLRPDAILQRLTTIEGGV